MRNHFRVCVVCIEHPERLLSSPFIGFLEEVAVPVSSLQCPCKPESLEDAATGSAIAQIEWKHACTREFWDHVVEDRKNYIPIAICVAHMRAIHQCLSQLKGPTLHDSYIAIFEEDVEFTTGAETAFVSCAEYLYWQQQQEEGSRLRNPDLIWLSHSTQNMNQLGRVGSSRQVWKHPLSHFQLRELTWLANDKGKGKGGKAMDRPAWVGQGSRAYVLSAEFAQVLLTQRIDNYWDLHMIDLIQGSRGSRAALLAFPMLARHDVDTARGDRGSGKLQTILGEHKDVDYILIKCTLGLFNRIRTICMALWVAHFHAVGVTVEWHVNEACDMAFEDVMRMPDLNAALDLEVPFLRIETVKTSRLMGPSRMYWRFVVHKVGEINSQVSFFNGVDFVREMWNDIFPQELQPYIPQTEEGFEASLYKRFRCHQTLEDQVRDYMRGCGSVGARHVGIHCRRGDLKAPMVHKLGPDTVDAIDDYMWGILVREAETQDQVVHFITDDKEYGDYVKEEFHPKYKNVMLSKFYFMITHTSGRLSERPSSLKFAMFDFEVLRQCGLRFCSGSSSVTDWLGAVSEEGTTFTFDTNPVGMTPIEWHPLTIAAKRDLRILISAMAPRMAFSLAVPQRRYITPAEMTVMRRLTSVMLEDFRTFLADCGLRPGTGPQTTTTIGKWMINAPKAIQLNKQYYREQQQGPMTTNWLTAVFSTAFYDYMLYHHKVIVSVEDNSVALSHAVPVKNEKTTKDGGRIKQEEQPGGGSGSASSSGSRVTKRSYHQAMVVDAMEPLPPWKQKQE